MKSNNLAREVELGQACVAAYNKGYLTACDAIELRLRRHFQKLWPHDETCAQIIAEVRKALDE